MKDSELRLGNIFQDRKGRICKVEVLSIDPEDTKIVAIKGGITSLPVRPIPLSEEVLLKCPEIQPSAWMPEMWTIRDPKSQFHIVKMNDRFVFRGLGMSVTYVDTLHHLQNLVYMVSSQELEVKWN